MTRSDGSTETESVDPRTVERTSTPPEDPAYYEALGRAIKVARTQFGWDRKDLANLANVSYAYLSDIETGRGRPGSRSLFAIAAALGRTPAELMGEAEHYRAQITDEPMAGTPLPSGRERPDGPEDPSKVRPSQPSSTRWHREVWRERLETSESAARAELHDIVERLTREDLGMALMLARRLFGGDQDAR